MNKCGHAIDEDRLKMLLLNAIRNRNLVKC